jgi:iron-sulfur cluster assembly protein
VSAITITEKAAKELKRIRVENNLPEEAYLRVGVKGGGCSGFSYALGFTNKPIEGDEIFESQGMKILVNKRVLPYLSGTELDFNDNLLDRKFVFNNPNATKICGCGESFGVKEEAKRKPLNIQNSGTIVSEEKVWEALRECYDPEIPVNIVDLGLIYKMKVEGEVVTVEMTLTVPGCYMGETIVQNVRERLLAVPGVQDVDVRLVFDPPWNPSMMSEEAKTRLNM